jgi:hypothetical protein
MSKRNTTQLDAKLGWIKDRLAKTVDIAMERVIAHNENPQYYPLPSNPKSLERALHKLFEALPRKNQKDTIEKVNKTLKAGRDARTKIYGDLVNIDFRSTAPVIQQVKVKPVPANLKITEADLTEIRSRLKLPSAVKPQKPSKPTPAQAVEATELAFEVINLTCVRPTDVRKDETSVAGVGIDNLGEAIEVAPFFIGDFKKGETLALGAKGRLFNFKLTVGEFPKTFFAAIFLVEKDWLRNSDFVNGLVILLAAVAAALSAISLTLLIVGLAGGPVTVALLEVVMGATVVFGLASTAVRRMIDDFSFPNGDTLLLDAPVAPGTVFNIDPLGFQIGELKGQYKATARWITA